MIIPIRCFSCGKVIGGLYETYKQKVDMGQDPKVVLDTMGLKRYCCRRMLLTHADLIDSVMYFD